VTAHIHSDWTEEADCPGCRAVLLEAFRAAPVVHAPLPVRHKTEAGAVRHSTAPGGVWHAGCSCGWRVHGHFARSTAMAQLTSRRLAELVAAQHMEDPSRQTSKGCTREGCEGEVG
jgi:hypothetical protein